jgi:hypothetical protein
MRLVAMAYHALGRQAESDAALGELIRKYEKTMAWNIACALAFRRESNAAFEWLDKAVQHNDLTVGSTAGFPLFANLRSDPLVTISTPNRHGSRATRGDQLRRAGAAVNPLRNRPNPPMATNKKKNTPRTRTAQIRPTSNGVMRGCCLARPSSSRISRFLRPR